jgi:hypothetical protein
MSFRKPACALAVLAALVISSATPANAATPPTRAPTSEEAMEPARNSADFDAPPWDKATIEQYKQKHAGDDDRVVARAPATRGRLVKASTRDAWRKNAKSPPRAHAAHGGLVVCGATPSMVRTGGFISADGFTSCTNGPADLLSNKNCIDVWSTGGYWTTLGCSDWRTCATCSFIAGNFYARTCTTLRYYRPVSKMTVVHGNTSSESYPGNYIQC